MGEQFGIPVTGYTASMPGAEGYELVTMDEYRRRVHGAASALYGEGWRAGEGTEEELITEHCQGVSNPATREWARFVNRELADLEAGTAKTYYHWFLGGEPYDLDAQDDDGEYMRWDLSSRMQDDIREQLNDDMAPCKFQDFLEAYLERDPDFWQHLRQLGLSREEA